MQGDKAGFRKVALRTFSAYVRMCCTVVIAVVVRLFLDCLGLLLGTSQDPAEVTFWFAHCGHDGGCVRSALLLLAAALIICTLFVWRCKSWIMDPAQNPSARRYSFALIVDAAAWVPISVGVGKTNAIVEWFTSFTKLSALQPFCCAAIACFLTLMCAVLSHVAMKYCDGVACQEKATQAPGIRGFGRHLIQNTLFVCGWAVGWSNWILVLTLMDALEPGASVHNTMLSAVVIIFFLTLSLGFYSKYGPEPVIPGTETQQLCYRHGYSSSIWRSFISYLVYSCIVFNVMCFCDPFYGVLHVLADLVYPGALSPATVMEVRALGVVFGMACVVTALVVLVSAWITVRTSVNEVSSMHLSRSAHRSRELMVRRRLSNISRTPSSSDVSDLAWKLKLVQNEAPASPRSSDFGASTEADDGLASEVDEREADDFYADLADGDDAAGPPRRATYRSPAFPGQAASSSQSTPRGSPEESEDEELPEVRRFSKVLCASVLVYDVLGLVLCMLWGAFTIRLYVTCFGWLARMHAVLYVGTTLVYGVIVTAALARFVFEFFPIGEEVRCKEFSTAGEGQRLIPADEPNVSEPFLSGTIAHTRRQARELRGKLEGFKVPAIRGHLEALNERFKERYTAAPASDGAPEGEFLRLGSPPDGA